MGIAASSGQCKSWLLLKEEGNTLFMQGRSACLEMAVGFSKAFFLSSFSSHCEFYYFLRCSKVQQHHQNPTLTSQLQLEAAFVSCLMSVMVFS